MFADYRDLEGWMAQACWVPQHLAAANSMLLVVLLLPALATRRWTTVAVTGVVAAAAFGSSAWIGGVTLAVVATGVGGAVLWRGTAADRQRLVAGATAAIVIAALVALPMLIAELGPLATRHGGAAVALHPYEVLGAWLPVGVRRVVDLPAFWLVLLPGDLPAVYPAGIVAFVAYLRLAPRRDPRVGRSRSRGAARSYCELVAGKYDRQQRSRLARCVAAGAGPATAGSRRARVLDPGTRVAAAALVAAMVALSFPETDRARQYRRAGRRTMLAISRPVRRYGRRSAATPGPLTALPTTRSTLTT